MSAKVSDLHYVGLAVPDLAAERAFFTDTWGLVEVAENDGMVYLAAEGSPHPYVIRLREESEKRTDIIGFSADSQAEVDGVFEQVRASQARIISEPAPAEGPAGGYAFRFFDPDGRAIEVVCDAQRRQHRTLAKGEAIPVGLSHVVLHTPDIGKLETFYREALGFRLSDWIGAFMVFLRCNPAHHRLAILPGPPALNYVAFDVSSVDELMRGLARMTERGVKLSWGPGRHTAGNNTFTYYLTPNGNAVEYTSDLEEVDEDTWIPQTYEATSEITDQWGTGRIITGNVPHAEMTPDKGLGKSPPDVGGTRRMIGKALVIGGGVGGMSAALALARRGVAVEIADADPRWRAYGAGISVTGLSLRAFDDLGILDEVRDKGFVGAGIRLRSVDGGVIMETPPAAPDAPPIARSGGIMRPDLHEIMSRKVRASGIRVTLGAQVTGFEQEVDGVTVDFPDGRSERFDLLVAADGIFSTTRERLFPDAAKPRFTGQGCWRIVTDRPSQVDRAEMFLGGPVKLGFNPVSRDKMYAFILEHVPDNPWFAPGEQLDHVAGLLTPFGGYVSDVRAGLGADSLVNYRPLEWVLLPAPWHKGRVVLIGDAVHATTPHMASGAGMAVEDGLVLAEELAGIDDVDKALGSFTERRFERARMVVENSVRIGEIEMSGGDQRDANTMLGDTMHKLQRPY